MRPLSEPVSRISGKTFSRKYIALGRILSEWEQIVGPEFSGKAIPVKLNYRKNGKTGKSLASLDIATSDAQATALHYQKDLILERINRVFGQGWIGDIRFVSVPGMAAKTPEKPKRLLTEDEKKFLSGMLEALEDQELKAKLEVIGREILKRS
ncbi:MAG: DUF721 domain-containing protein [Alphaproteobacteria bacterium]|nr:DUF721 domain-containing protein [Alphaproteobacteria bacterium]MBP7757660.1 DUF721 domain-containing protein [Alphaproteobacteria bacterium]MBP7761140.1 DUF721 domain-containing protein [Alphaproteobacteria bacterium]MBP7904787.1 DUF721 domain-containing protein [Alphaproteobacteria bacterium]